MDLKNSGYSHILFFDSPDEAASSLAERIIAQTQSAIKKNGRCVWAVSGGSTILKFYDALFAHANQINEFGDELIVFWVDERAVPHSHSSSNYGTAYEYFWKNMNKVQLIPVPYHEELSSCRNGYDEILNQNGIEKGTVNITILGMGTDGHTASLFPENPVLKEQKKKIVTVEDPSVDLPRISMTFSFINSSDSIYLFFYGNKKAETFRQAVISNTIDNYPILGIDKKKLQIYTDDKLKANQ